MYQWKSKYYGMEVSQLKKLKEMESELSQYKKIAAELTLQNSVLKDVIEKKAIGPAEKQEPVDYSREAHGISLRQACILFSLHFSVYYYKPKPNEDHLVRDALSSFGEGYQNSFLYCLENQ
jgi:putative transposase|tara:strand:- start:111 stop:473 length:363 start_codon:yes stop_codon:yes gene_type:complete